MHITRRLFREREGEEIEKKRIRSKNIMITHLQKLTWLRLLCLDVASLLSTLCGCYLPHFKKMHDILIFWFRFLIFYFDFFFSCCYSLHLWLNSCLIRLTRLGVQLNSTRRNTYCICHQERKREREREKESVIGKERKKEWKRAN
jgi:hypothetical protein